MSVTTISPAEISRLVQNGQSPAIFDVRTPAEFAGVHVVGARSVPFDELDPAAIAAQRQGTNGPIYVICQSGGRSAKACERLTEAGIGPVYSVEGGTTAWERQGFPVSRGSSRVISLERQVRVVAGSLVFLGTLLAWRIHPLFLIVPGFVGAGLVFAGVTDYCGMGLLLGKMPWNRRGAVVGG